MYKHYHEQQKSWPVAQTVLSWLFVIIFVFLASDRGVYRKAFSGWKETTKNRILPGTPEYDKLSAEMEALVESIRQKAKDGTLTIEQGASAQMKAMAMCSQSEVKWSGFTTEIRNLSLESFIASWQPPEKMSEYWRKLFENDPNYKRQELESMFLRQWDAARDEARELYPETRAPIDNAALAKFGLWLLKWYWLLTVPSLFIFLLNRKFKGEPVLEEILLQPGRLVLACLAGPIGLLIISETVARVKRYNQLVREFYRQTGSWDRSDSEEQAILRQLEEPLLRFDQALEIVRGSSERLRKPLTIYAMAGLISFLHQPIMKTMEPAVVIQGTTSDTEQGSAAELLPVVSVSKSKVPPGTKLMLAILPVAVDWPVKFSEDKAEPLTEFKPGTVFWEHTLARGPPQAAQGQSFLICSALDCAKQKG